MSKEFKQFRKSMEEATEREEERKALKEIKDFYEKMPFEKKRKLLYKTLNSLKITELEWADIQVLVITIELMIYALKFNL